MKKKSLIYIFIIILIICAVIFAIFNFKSNKTSLYVNGHYITSKNIIINDKTSSSDAYAQIPLIEVLKALDAKITWTDDAHADIEYLDKKYKLNLDEIFFGQEGIDTNYISPRPGGTVFYHQVIDKDIILDHGSIRGVLFWMTKDDNMDIDVNVDYDKKSIHINVNK